MIRKDDREKDQLEVDLELRAAEIQAKHGASVDVAHIRAHVDRDREMIRGIQQGVQQQNVPPNGGGVQ
jgi:reverse gyrase